MVQLPLWLTLAIAGLVALFGIYRLWLFALGEQKYRERAGRGPMYRMRRRNHLFMGVIFLILCAWLLATAFGIGPFGEPAP